ncbi:hypothetical protein [Streptomyces cyanogenus]|uniref:UL36 very large tegument protein n=1 Tax=Streptomyces cyanogenus TaxID=80860 RepID=A0ABX7TYZ5_STRCY|nr:hypothetical protein [Streptomyces cyanogenus]QTE02008.1 hypothetical protein S1361_32045 [Streptomyces cyanogenus]
MGVHQLPGPVGEFASYLDALLARLDPRGGWSGVFWQRDPEGMRACLDGREVPPWDVVEALLEDLGGAYGPAAAAAERERARALHAAALTAYDARPGARDALADRLDVMLRERRYAAERQAELTRLLSAPVSSEEAESLRLDLAWAHDDHDRATARCTELRARLARLDGQRARGGGGGAAPDAADGRTAPGGGGAEVTPGGRGSGATPVARPPRPAGTPADPPRFGPAGPAAGDPRFGGAARSAGASAGQAAPSAPAAVAPPEESGAAGAPGRPRKRRRGSARFAGVVEADPVAPVVAPQAPVAGVPEAAAGRRTPRGARFAGVEEPAEPVRVAVAAVDEGAGAAVAAVVEQLTRLRAEGRSGEAHVLLVEAARWPVGRLPLLAEALHRAGLGADWATLLWEAAALPAEQLVAAADALAAAGRHDDGREMLRQGVARPAEQIGAVVLRLDGEGREREVRALLDAYVRVRTPEEAARCAAPDPRRLVPLLLRAALGVSEERHWDLVHALRVAGHTT